MNLFSINTGYFKLDGGAMFGVVPKVIWQKTNPADENNLCSWAMRSLLVESGNRLILIDNGIGNKQKESFFAHFYLHGNDSLEKSLKKYGFTPDDITDNVLTHLHFDHAGGGIIRDNETGQLKPLFKNATYWTSKRQWENAIHPNDREKASYFEENLLPMQEAGQLKFIENEGQLFPGFDVRIYDGHTPGQVIPFITYKDTKVIFAADLLPSTGHIPLPYIMSYDMQPIVTLEEKKKFLEECADNQYVIFFQHDYYNECCTVRHTPKGVRLDRVFSLEEFCRN
ncbi:MAG TPA: MBL fold metallo-hydrolase [Bacteroidia bacterium]|nr:MBL fold metallo-hydrolase [Bacteroidia bacterium]HRS57934.1 MBL fold metallo-hydrolase [Bacteroidia bacterium]HRU67977.1 MBL fold metallo-hydrolase [Bacteroidia bacterium]